MKFPLNLRPDPYRKNAPRPPLGPPSFRTAVHRPLDQSDPKCPPSFERGYRETLIDRPGYVVEASDRTYVTTPKGSIRRTDWDDEILNTEGANEFLQTLAMDEGGKILEGRT